MLKQLLIILLILSGGCNMKAQQQKSPQDTAEMTATAALSVSSSAFQNGQPVPQKYSCDGENISPALSWSAPPKGTQSFALVCEDPDAPHGTFIHWVMYNIPAGEHGLAENIQKTNALPNGTRQGKNGAGQMGYTGPCPPPGKLHHYHFKLFALDTKCNIPGDPDRDQLMSAIQGHILGQGET